MTALLQADPRIVHMLHGDCVTSLEDLLEDGLAWSALDSFIYSDSIPGLCNTLATSVLCSLVHNLFHTALPLHNPLSKGVVVRGQWCCSVGG